MNAQMRNVALWMALVFGASGPTLAADTTTALNAEAAQTDSLAASHGEAQVSGRIAGTFSNFSGSPENASSLVNGLRNGSQITLTSEPGAGGTNGTATSATFTPPTRPMGHGIRYSGSSR